MVFTLHTNLHHCLYSLLKILKIHIIIMWKHFTDLRRMPRAGREPMESDYAHCIFFDKFYGLKANAAGE